MVFGMCYILDDNIVSSISGRRYGGSISSCYYGSLQAHRFSIFEIVISHNKTNASTQTKISTLHLENSQVSYDSKENLRTSFRFESAV